MNFKPVTPSHQDRQLLAALGLKPWTAPVHEEIFVGEVCPYPAHEEPGGRTRIAVYVCSMPAEFYRFVIHRRSDDADYSGMERLVLKTGSGTLSRFWPMALAVASNCLEVGPVERVSP